MRDNDILEEIWATREAYAARFNYDLDAMHRDIKEQERREGRTLVSFPPRRPDGWVEPPAPDAKHDADEWDRRIEADAAAGKLDALAADASAEHQAGRATEL